MNKYIKSYHLFVSSHMERFGIYVAYPILLIIGNVLIAHFFSNYIICLIASMLLTCAVELFCDHSFFGGITSRDTNKLDYIKTSHKGMDILLFGIITDAVRRFITVSLIITISLHNQVSATTLFTGVFATLFLTELGLIICRFCITIQFAFVISSLLQFPIIWLAILIAAQLLPLWAPFVLALLWLVFTFLGRYIIMRTARRSYYDT